VQEVLKAAIRRLNPRADRSRLTVPKPERLHRRMTAKVTRW
jgi:hypothetical protein